MSVREDKVQVSVVVDGKQGIQELGRLEMEANDLRHTMQGLKKDSQEYVQASEQYKQVKARMAEIREEIGVTGMTMKQLRTYARELQTELDTTATKGTARYEELKEKVQEVNAAMARQKEDVKGASSMWSKISTEVKQFGILAVGALGFQFVTQQISNLIEKGKKLADELSDVQKTTGMTAKEVRELNSDLSRIDTRTSTSELRKMAAAAGQLGIATDDIKAFTVATDKLTVALGDEFEGGAEQVTKVMGGLRNIFSDVKSDKVDEDMLHIGNAINALGAAGAATGPVVADFANRIGGVGITMGLTSGQVLGLSATMQELNITTERGGTAVVKILQKMASEPEKFAKVAGLATKDFAHLVNTDLYGALVKVTEGFGKGGSQATAMATVLNELGVDGAGASEVMAKLAGNTALLDTKVKLASTSLGQTNSIMSEFATKNDNLAGKLEKLMKVLSGAFTNSTFNSALEAMVDGLSELFNLKDEAEGLTDAFRAQQSEVQNLEKTTVPLLDRYDELMSKTNRNSEEQKELDTIMQQVAKTIPSAVKEVDAYGRALSLNTEAGREFVQMQKNMLLVKNDEAIRANTEQLEMYTRKIEVTRQARNKLDEQGRHVMPSSDEEGFRFLSDTELMKMDTDLASFQAKAQGLKGIISELKGEKSAEQIKAELDGRWMAYVFGNKKGLNDDATMQQGLLAEIDEKLKALREKQLTDRSKAEIRADEAAIKALVKQRADLLGDADDKAEKAQAKRELARHDADVAVAEKNFRALQAVALQEQAKLRVANQDADQQAINQVLTHYEELIKKAQGFAANSLLSEKQRREALQTVDLLADEKEEAVESLKQQQREKRAAEDLKFENEHALAKLNLRILLAKRNEHNDPAELEGALVAKVEKERDIELQNLKLTKEQREIIEQEAADRIDAIHANSMAKRQQEEARALQQFVEYTSRTLDGAMAFAQQKDDAALRSVEKSKNSRLKSLEAERKAGTITTEKYEEQKIAIEAEAQERGAAIKTQQFEREKVANVLKITMDTAVAIVKALAEGGPIAGPVMATVISGLAGLQLAAIYDTDTPAFAEGGGTAGRYTMGQALQLPHQNLSRHPGGLLRSNGAFLATVNEVGNEYFVPHHLLEQPQVANAVQLIEAIRTGTPAFAEGGFSSTPAPTFSAPVATSAAAGLDTQTAQALLGAINRLNYNLEHPTPTKSYVVQKELDDAAKQLAYLQSTSSF